MFVQQLLSRGYGFDERSFGDVAFQKKVGTQERRGRGRGARCRGAGLPWLRRSSVRTCGPQAGDTAVGWALGYMLNLTNLIPADPPGLRKGTDFSSWVVLLLLFAAMLLAAFALLLQQARSTKSGSTI